MLQDLRWTITSIELFSFRARTVKQLDKQTNAQSQTQLIAVPTLPSTWVMRKHSDDDEEEKEKKHRNTAR